MAGPAPVRRVGAVMVVALALLTGACSGSGDGDEGPDERSSPSHVVVTLPPEPPGIRMSFLQQRIWEGTPLADVRIINITDHRLSVRRIGLDWPGYPGAPQRLAAAVSPGQTLDLHYRLPAPDCSIDPTTPATGVAVTGSRTIRREVDEAGMRFLVRIWGADCARLRIRRMLTIGYDVPPPDTAAVIPQGGGLDSTMPIALRLARRPASSDSSAVVVDSVQGTVLFDLTLRRPGEGLGEARPSAGVPLVVDPGRCDEHARSQASQPFAFRLWLRIGEEPDPLSVLAVPGKDAQRRLLRFLDLACAGRTAH